MDFFELAARDDIVALKAAWSPGQAPSSQLNPNGETLLLFSLYRNAPKCAAFLNERQDQLTLHEAAASGANARVRDLLRSAPWTINLLSCDGWTALHLAAFLGNSEGVKLLIDAGASASIMSRAFQRNYALHAAAAGRRLDRAALEALMRATGSPDLRDAEGYTPLMIAAANGFEPAVTVLLAAGADKSLATQKGETAASFARARGHNALVAHLE